MIELAPHQREAVERIIRDGKRAGEVIARIRALVRKTGTEKERLLRNGRSVF